MTVTDVDADGVAEIAFLCKLSCRSDVSPARLKLIMYEGAQKYAIRGSTKVPDAGGGRMVVDRALERAREALRVFAVTRWEKYVVEDRFDQF